MKKILVTLVVAFMAFSCGEELLFNSPTLQGYKGEELWKASAYRANIDANGVLRITATKGLEVMNLIVNPASEGTFTLGNPPFSSRAEFIGLTQNQSSPGVTEVSFSTNNAPDESVQLYPADGEISITELDLEARTVTGRYFFNAFNASGLQQVNFNRGFFFKVPILSIESPTGTGVDVLCENATSTADATLINLNAVADTTSPEYTQACNAHVTALTNKINACGDDDGLIQDEIDALGDCTEGAGLQQSIIVTIDGVERVFNDNITVELVGTTRTIRGEDTMTMDFIQFVIEQDLMGMLELAPDTFVINLNGVNHEPIPMNPTFGELTIDVTTNTTTNIEATFSGAVNDYMGGLDVGLTAGVINITY